MQDQRPVVWLCGFPSSGNLKAQIGLANLVFGRVTSITELDTRVPVMSIGPEIPSSPADVKLNFVFTHHVANRYMLSRVRSYRIIYVVRNPVDAGISSAGYLLPRHVDMKTADDAALAATKAKLIDDFLAIGSYPEYIAYDYGTWPSHVVSWREFSRTSGVPMMIVRFEDMVRDGPVTLQKMADFIGLAASPARIADAVDNWSIAASSAMEEQAINRRERSRFYKPEWSAAYARGWRYHGKGLSGYGKEQLSPEQWECARALFGKIAATVNIEIR